LRDAAIPSHLFYKKPYETKEKHFNAQIQSFDALA
jgi:hypothetical protein